VGSEAGIGREGRFQISNGRLQIPSPESQNLSPIAHGSSDEFCHLFGWFSILTRIVM